MSSKLLNFFRLTGLSSPWAVFEIRLDQLGADLQRGLKLAWAFEPPECSIAVAVSIFYVSFSLCSCWYPMRLCSRCLLEKLTDVPVTLAHVRGLRGTPGGTPGPDPGPSHREDRRGMEAAGVTGFTFDFFECSTILVKKLFGAIGSWAKSTRLIHLSLEVARLRV